MATLVFVAESETEGFAAALRPGNVKPVVLLVDD
jgi:hypothetical protein